MPSEYYHRSHSLYGLGRYEEAADEARRGIEACDDPRCHALLAAILSRDKKGWKESSQCLKAALSLEPNSGWVHYIASICYMNRADLTNAERHIRQALHLAPYEAYNHRQLAYFHRRRRDWKLALQELDIALQLGPNDTQSLADKVTVLTYLGRKAEAAKVKDTLLQLVPDHDEPQATAGFVALTEGDYKKAFDFYREALRINPNSEKAREGVLDALRSRYRAYRWFFAFTVWNRSKPSGLIGLAFFVLFRAVASSLESTNLPKPVYLGLSVILLSLIFLWLAKVLVKPLTNIALMFHPLGRMLLNPHQRAETTSLLVSIFVFGVSIALANATTTRAYAEVAFVAGLSIFVMAMLNNANERGPLRWTLFGIFLTCQLVATGKIII